MTTPKPPYKSTMGTWYTVALFHETRHQTADSTRANFPNPLFSLYGEVPGLINCQQTFVDMRDPTGFKWAKKYLGDWRHWMVLCECDWFKKAFESWQTALKMELKAQAIEKIIEIASGDTAQALPAAKYVAEEGWTVKNVNRGRPSDEEVKGNLKRAMKVASETEQDAERIGLKVVGGTDTRG